MIFVIFGSNMGSWRVGRCLEGFLEVARFVVTEYGVVASHGDPFQAGLSKNPTPVSVRAENVTLKLDFCFFDGYLEGVTPI